MVRDQARRNTTYELHREDAIVLQGNCAPAGGAACQIRFTLSTKGYYFLAVFFDGAQVFSDEGGGRFHSARRIITMMPAVFLTRRPALAQADFSPVLVSASARYCGNGDDIARPVSETHRAGRTR